MTKPHVDSLDLVNDSGYPFQLLVEEIVRSQTQLHGWRVICREKPWRDLESGEEGYIDLILAKGSHHMVIECKCPKEPQDWIFLVAHGTEPTVKRVCCLLLEHVARGEKEIKTSIAWKDMEWNPNTLESDFCVREQDDRNRPLLERQSRTLLRSIECLAEEKQLLLQERKVPYDAAYLPVILTTAQLKAGIFKASDVRLSDGKIPHGVASFQQIDCVRFRKTILTKYGTREMYPQDLADASRLQQRTILVVQAQNLSKMLCVV
jgi:hypothetical protein